MSKKSEAKARRQIAKRWAIVSKGAGYKHAAARDSTIVMTNKIEEDAFDSILLSLSPRNNDKSQSCQRKLLRRIVEKRQAQAIFKRVGRSEDMFTPRLIAESCHWCMRELHRYQNCI